MNDYRKQLHGVVWERRGREPEQNAREGREEETEMSSQDKWTKGPAAGSTEGGEGG